MLAMLITSACARTDAPPSGGSTFFRGGSVYHPDADMDAAGSFSVHRYYAEAGLAYLFGADRMVSLSGGYGQDDYRFSGTSEQPWNNIDNYRVGVFSRWGFRNGWTAFGAGSVRAYGEPDASFSQSLTAALFGGASFRFSDRLKLGPGLGVVGQLEDNPRYFPIVVIDWDITERLSLSTGGGLAATAGPGLALSYRLSKSWQIGFTGRYESKRFRLSGGNPAANGIGEDRSIPVLASVSYVLYPGTQLTLLGGMNLYGRLSVEDENGSRLESSAYDAAPFGGLAVGLRL
jgi:hypothetical protein